MTGKFWQAHCDQITGDLLPKKSQQRGSTMGVAKGENGWEVCPSRDLGQCTASWFRLNSTLQESQSSADRPSWSETSIPRTSAILFLNFGLPSSES